MSTAPVIKFDLAMDTTTLTTANISVVRSDNSPLTINPTYNATTKELTLTPTTSLDYQMTYTIKLSTGVKSAATAGALPLAAAWQSQFTVTGVGVSQRIDSGATANVTASDGSVWLLDQYVAGGTVGSTTSAITNTTDQKLYQTYRTGLWNYTINIPNGTYDVRLLFVEPTYTATAKRVFSVDVLNTSLVNDIANLDVYAAAGARNKAYSVTVPNVLVTGRAVRLKAVAVTDNPIIAGVEITPKPPTVVSTTGSATSATATFSQLMTTSSINGTTFWVSNAGGTTMFGTVTYDSTNKIATWTPTTALASGTYTATVSGTRDYYGLAQQTVKTWTFSVP
jgi:hypothetical protein